MMTITASTRAFLQRLLVSNISQVERMVAPKSYLDSTSINSIKCAAMVQRKTLGTFPSYPVALRDMDDIRVRSMCYKGRPKAPSVGTFWIIPTNNHHQVFYILPFLIGCLIGSYWITFDFGMSILPLGDNLHQFRSRTLLGLRCLQSVH